MPYPKRIPNIDQMNRLQFYSDNYYDFLQENHKHDSHQTVAATPFEQAGDILLNGGGSFDNVL